MFCFKDYCECGCKNCEEVILLDNLELEFKEFTSEDDIEIAQEILCLVSSWGEPPYFLVMKRKERGIANAFDGKLLVGNAFENTKILKWAYLPVVKL